MDIDAIIDANPKPEQSLRLIWEAVVQVDDRVELGEGPYGLRAITNILGGAFRGGPDFPDFHGRIRSGGADRQMTRPDGIRMLDALYEMEVHDGSVITIRNNTLVDDDYNGGRYFGSVLTMQAPIGRWDFLNKRVILGTLNPLRPDHDAVLIRGLEVNVTPFIPRF